MSERPHLSHSQIDMLSRCELQWYYRYVLGLKVPPGVAAVIGKGTHGAVYRDLDQKRNWGVLLETDEVKDAARDATVRAWEREPPKLNEGDPDKGEAIDTAVALADVYHRRIAPEVEPIALEQAFLIEVPQLPFDLLGVVDVETAETVRDTKTKGKKPAEDAASRSTQLALYHLNATLSGSPAKDVAFDYLIKTKVPQAITLRAQPTETDHRALMKRVELAAASIQSGVFKPTWAGNWACSPKWCGYWDKCEFGARKAVSVGLVDPRSLTSRLIRNPHAEDTETPDVDAA